MVVPDPSVEVISIADGVDSISMPSRYEDRVFVGGAYSGPTARWLNDIRDSVIACHRTPIMARDFKIPVAFLRHYVEVLITHSRLVVLELSLPSGAVNELEFLRHVVRPTLCLWTNASHRYPGLSQMCTNHPVFALNNRRFADRGDIRRFVREFIMAW